MMKFQYLTSFKSVHTGKHSNNMVKNRFHLLKWRKPSGRITSTMLLLNLLVCIGTKCLKYGQIRSSFIFIVMLKAGQDLSSKSLGFR